jgi:hypothetical protein
MQVVTQVCDIKGVWMDAQNESEFGFLSAV